MAVLEDVRNEWVSPERAAEVYGVAVTAAGGGVELDADRTRELRAAAVPSATVPSAPVPSGAGR